MMADDGTQRSVAKSFSKDTVLNNESKLDLSAIPKLKRRIKGTPRQSKRNCTEKNATEITSHTFSECIEEGEKIAYGSSVFESFSTDLQCYLELLLLYKGFTPIGDFFNHFVLRDYDMNARQLEANTFLFVRRKSLCFIESAFHWCFTCDCNTTRASLINGLSDSVDISYEAFLQKYPRCLHIDAIAFMMERYDSRENLEAEEHSYSFHRYQYQYLNDDNRIQELSWDGDYLCVTSHGSCGIVTYKEKMSCITCKSPQCEHTSFLVENAKTLNIDLPENASKKISSCPWVKVFSSKGIPFDLDVDLKQQYSRPLLDRIPEGLLAEPRDGVCGHCGSMWSNELLNSKSLPLVDKKITTIVQVAERKCSNNTCDALLKYDGQEHCVFHTSHALIAYEVLFEFMDLFTRNRTTLYTYFLSLRDSHERSNDLRFQKIFSYAHFKFAWYGFLELLCSTIDFEKGFQCGQCGSSPVNVIMDATALAHRKDLKFWSSNLQNATSEKVLQVPYTCHKDRVLIADPYTRSLLQRYAREQPPLTMLEFTKMVELLGFHSLPLQNLVKSFGNSTCPPPYVPFLKSLALDSPICGMFHPSKNLRQTLIEMREKDPKTSPKLLEDLQMQLPLVFKLICLLSRTPPELTELLISLEEKAAESYPPDTMASLSQDETELKLNSFFPSLPIQRCRGTYEMDIKGCRKSSHDCNKKSRGHPSLLPGVFCLFCEHGVCYGYELMDSNESPNIPFTLLLTRFKKAPSTVIYDNSCKLHTYCLNRYPDFFRGTWFLVDRLHWFNHRGCNDGYNLNEYAQFSSLNSQAAEQCNSSLGKLKSMLSYMTNKNFHLHCKFYLWVLNLRKQLKTDIKA